MPSLLKFEDKVYYDNSDDIYHAVHNLRLYLNLEGKAKVYEDTCEAFIGQSPVECTYVDGTTQVADLNCYRRS